MYAMIRTYPDPACRPDDVIRAGRRFATVLDHAPGFVSCFILRAQNGRLAIVSLFEQQANFEAAERLPGACLADHLQGLADSAELTGGEVVFQRGL